MFKIQRIKALQDDTPSPRNLANEFINVQWSCATLMYLLCCNAFIEFYSNYNFCRRTTGFLKLFIIVF